MNRRAVKDVFLIYFNLILSLRKHHKGEHASVNLGSAMHHIQATIGSHGGVGFHFLEDEVNDLYVARKDSEVESAVASIWLCVFYKGGLACSVFLEALSHYIYEQL